MQRVYLTLELGKYTEENCGMEAKLTKFIFKYSGREQIKVLLLTLVIFPLLYFSLELPKTIINDAISAQRNSRVLGMEFDPISCLLILCAMLLATVLINGAFKMRINTYKGVIGERMVRRLRYQLVSRVMIFPSSQFQRTSQGEIISIITAETEPLAGFIGDSLAQPLFQGGTMLTILIFMFMQDPLLGLVSISMIPLQAYIIPKMQRKLNSLKKHRVKVIRRFSGQIGEVVDGQRDVKLNGTHRFHLAQFSHTLGRLFKVRLDIFKQKFLMKFINNFLNQLPPIMFYALGGILVIRGELSIGALVAALAAYKDLVSPWKELLIYYQQFQDCKVRYEYIQEQFAPTGLIAPNPITAHNRADFSAGLHLHSLFLKNERGDFISQNISLSVPPGSQINICSDSELMLRRLVMNIVGLEPIAAGEITVGQQSITQTAGEDISKKIAYIGPDPFFVEGTILQNINYGLRLLPPKYNYATLSPGQLLAIEESRASGNSTDGIHEVWTDFSLAGVDDWKSLSLWLQDIMSAIGSRRMVFEFGLKDYINPLAIEPTIADKFSLTKENLFTSLRGIEASELIERFDINAYNDHLSVIENITFAMMDSPNEHSSLQTICNDQQFTAFLQRVNVYKALRDIGEKLAYTIIQHIEESDPTDQLENKYRFYDVDAVRMQLSNCIGRPEHLPSCEFLLAMALGLRVSVQGSDWIDAELKQQLLNARKQLIAKPVSILASHFEYLSKESMNRRLSVMENLLWGFEISPHNHHKHQKLVDIVERALIKNEAEALVLIVISLSQVGIRGERLPQQAKHNIQLVRALMKRPKVLLMHNALPDKSDAELQSLLLGIKKILPDTSVIMFSNKKIVTADRVRYYQLDIDGLHPLAETLPLHA